MESDFKVESRLAVRLQVLPFPLLLLLLIGLAARPAAKEIPIGPPVLGAHQHIDQRIDAGGQVDEQVASYVEPMQLGGTLPDLGHRDGQVADDEPHKDHQYHLEQPPILGAHPSRVNGGGIGGIAHGRVQRFPRTEAGEGGAQRGGNGIGTLPRKIKGRER